MGKARYQSGSIHKAKTALGMTYYIRFTRPDKSRPRFRLGLVKDLPNKAALERSASEARKTFNESQECLAEPRSFGDVIARYVREEMPKRFSTSSTYRGMLRKHIHPRWASTPLSEVRPIDVREWLNGLDLSSRTRGHVRDMIRILFRHAMLWEWLPATVNPMSLFQLKGSTRRREKPRVLTTDEYARLLQALPTDPVRTMAIVAGCLGLRMSEISGLQWNDFDWIGGLVKVERGVVHGHRAEVKTEASQRSLPVHPNLAQALHAYRAKAKHKRPDDYVFASADPEKPYAMNMLQQRVLRPAFAAAGITGPHLGWHTFRHSYRSWLGANGVKPEDQRDLMRHSDIAMTLNVYGGSFAEPLREANDAVVRQILQ